MKETTIQSCFAVEEVDSKTVPSNNAFIEVENAFVGAEQYLTEALLPIVLPELIVLHGLDDPIREEQELDQTVVQYQQCLDFLRNANDEDAERAIRNHAYGLFIVSGMDHEPNAQELLEDLLAKQKADFAEMLTMNDEQLRERLKLTDDQRAEVYRSVLRPEVEGAVIEMLRILLRKHRGSTITVEELGCEIIANMHVGMHDDELPRLEDRNIHGLTYAQTERHVYAVLGAIHEHGLLADGTELYWKDEDRADESRTLWDAKKESEVELGRFILKTVLKS